MVILLTLNSLYESTKLDMSQQHSISAIPVAVCHLQLVVHHNMGHIRSSYIRLRDHDYVLFTRQGGVGVEESAPLIVGNISPIRLCVDQTVVLGQVSSGNCAIRLNPSIHGVCKCIRKTE